MIRHLLQAGARLVLSAELSQRDREAASVDELLIEARTRADLAQQRADSWQRDCEETTRERDEAGREGARLRAMLGGFLLPEEIDRRGLDAMMAVQEGAKRLTMEGAKIGMKAASEWRQEAERRFDCHGGPGACTPACGACVSCLARAIDYERERATRAEARGKALRAQVEVALTITPGFGKSMSAAYTDRSYALREALAAFDAQEGDERLLRVDDLPIDERKLR